MKKEDIPVQLEALQAQLLRERKAHAKEIKCLEKEYADKFTSVATNAMSFSAPTDYAFAVANAQGRPTPITATTSMKTFSTQRAS